ncbi:peptidoglycan recognition protein 4-like [Macrosteles quadrilineatus]|uniref:peptidoglycan recognition protein 4-like n=1 Tax=Macrosteles quadrilineatus TaxID=74068 RepID=UPI0023E27DAF|nr:peptidoglycan recognition protein 4-like [Macrosteles quadrilineatus]
MGDELPNPLDTVEKFEIFTREEWGALPPKGFKILSNRGERVIFTYDIQTDECKTTEECAEVVRDMQKKHMDEGSDDIKYNFLIGGDYNVYEGRGWNVRPCETLKYSAYRHKRIDFGFIGRFEGHEYVPIRMTAIAFELLRIGERCKYLEDPVRINEIRGPPAYENIVHDIPGI